jgi:hypothetical protein
MTGPTADASIPRSVNFGAVEWSNWICTKTSCINQILASQDDATMKAGFMKLLEED